MTPATKSITRDVAIVGIGMTPPMRNSGKSVGHLALEACREAIRDAGLGREHIDGVCGVYTLDAASVWPGYVVGGLGLPKVVWSSISGIPSTMTVIDGIAAVASGLCETALCYHAKYRWDVNSVAARNDPLRQSPALTFDPMMARPLYGHLPGTNGFAAYMRRHMHEFGSRREHFGKIVVSNRTNAQKNPRALFCGQRITLNDYMNTSYVYAPFTLLDMDMPLDVATAVVITTAERARDLAHRPVLIDAACSGVLPKTDQIFQPFDGYPAARLVMKTLWERTGYSPKDIDLANIYDGFSVISMDWIEAAFCARGEGAALIDESWDEDSGQIKLFGRIPVNTHGGNLSEGRTQGMGQILEAVSQLRGESGPRQVKGAKLALASNACNPIDAAMILRAD